MPPRTALSARATRVVKSERYICPSCIVSSAARALQRRADPQNISLTSIRHSWKQTPSRGNPSTRLRTKSYSTNSKRTLASSTAINAPAAVPLELRALRQQLHLLQEKASSYVDLSRLQLALRSLQSADPVIRVAFLGLGVSGVKAARRLARVLLADALNDEENWERQLVDEVEDDGRSLLLRYGSIVEDTGVQPATTPLLKEMIIPSLFLQRWNVEILVTGLNASSGQLELTELEEGILVPPLTIPGAGRVAFVRYPVHKAVVVADGVQGAIEFGRLSSELTESNLIRSALSLPVRTESTPKSETEAKEVDVDLAVHALGLFRTNKANGAIFSNEWQTSRVGSIGSWIAGSSSSISAEQTEGIKPAVHNLIASLLSSTSNALSRSESSAETSSAALTIPDGKRQNLQQAIASWSEESHRDLQTNLSTALLSSTWRRTTWWRLFYRIDEVSISASDVLRRGWLAEAEQSLAFLSGRILESGLATAEQLKGGATAEEAEKGSVRALLDDQTQTEMEEWKAAQNSERGKQEKIQTVAELMQMPPFLQKVREESGLNAFFDPPWPQTIQLARQQMLHQTVPSIHATAQRLMLASLSTIGGTGALGAWLWVASGGVALYEGGAIAALGLVWSLRRLQTKWSTVRQTFVDTAKDDARRVLRDVESRLSHLVRDGGRTIVREEDRKEWQEAREAVTAVHDALVKISRDADK